MEERYFVGTALTSTKAYYMGGLYEIADGAVKKYYSIAGQTVALRDDSGLQYLLTDHLGSVVAVTNASGTLTSQQCYLPFGEVRTIPDSPITITDFGFTGQRALSGTGLMDYRARFYSPYLNRFIQPDSMLPNAANPQEFNRYSYVNNAPINFNDPSGHSRKDVIRRMKRAYGSSWHQYSRAWNRYGDSALPNDNEDQQAEEDRQEEIERIIEEFGLIIPSTEGSSYTGIEIKYDPNLTIDAETNRIEGGLITIRLGPGAFDLFKGSAGWVASIIDHEFCHAKQLTGASCFDSPRSIKTVGSRWYSPEDYQGRAMNEVEAYAYVLWHADKYDLTYAEKVEKYERYAFWLAFLLPVNRRRAQLHYFILAPAVIQ
ncbi:MAG: RHS repeat domain-containing protein [Chloroflexota bacterium]